MSTNGGNPHSLIPDLPDELARLAEGLTLPDPMDAPPLRWGIIGAGGIAKTFARDVPAYTRSRIATVAARDADRAEAFAADFGADRAYGSYDQLVADPGIDAIYVSTIHPMHADHALLALRAGKPVLVEKSFTMTADQARKVTDAAGQAGLFTMEAMWSRHLPHYRVIRQIIANGELGHVVSVQADHGQSLRDRARMVQPELGGGALLDLGIYPVSFLHEILGKPTEMIATGRLLPGEFGISSDTHRAVQIDQGSVAVLKVDPQAGNGSAAGRPGIGPDGALGVARSNLDGRSATSAEIVFERGALELPLQFYRPGVLRLRTFGEGTPKDGGTVDWDSTVPGGFQYEAAEVARCLEAGLTESPDMTWQDTIEVMQIMDDIRAQIGVIYPWE